MMLLVNFLYYYTTNSTQLKGEMEYLFFSVCVHTSFLFSHHFSSIFAAFLCPLLIANSKGVFPLWFLFFKLAPLRTRSSTHSLCPLHTNQLHSNVVTLPYCAASWSGVNWISFSWSILIPGCANSSLVQRGWSNVQVLYKAVSPYLHHPSIPKQEKYPYLISIIHIYICRVFFEKSIQLNLIWI